MFRKILIGVLVFVALAIRAQFPAPPTLSFNSPLPTPGVDSYTIASQKINLLPVSKYGFITGNASNLQNLRISSYPPYVNNNYNDPQLDPNYYNINTDLTVGTTDGAGNVDAIGGFNYAFPIVCSPGTSGIQPKLSIAYNSNSFSGLLGKGFNIAGLSAIMRTNKTVFYDGINDGIKFTTNDVFSMDGQRLLAKNGPYGQPNSTYKTEVENYYNITSYGILGSGPQYFIVTTPDGMTMEFGNSNTSKTKDIGNTEILAWYVNRIYDRFGNYMDFVYNNNSGEVTIANILYTGNLQNNISPYNKIEFTYVDRSDNAPIFIGGKEFARQKIVKTITCKDINNNSVRRYVLDYKYELATLLSKITEIDGQGNQLNPTFIDWTKSNADPNHPSPSNQIVAGYVGANNNVSSNVLTVAADLNADGRKDIICFQNTGLLGPFYVQNSNPPQPILYPTTFDVNISIAPQNIYKIDFNPVATNQNFENDIIEVMNTSVLDEDDDGADEVFITYTKFFDPNPKPYYIKKIKANGNSYNVTTEISGSTFNQNIGFVSTWHNFSNYHSQSEVYGLARSGFSYFKQDISGDNLNDIIESNNNGIRVSISNNQQINIPMDNIIKLKIGDFDGDGVGDLFVLRRNESICTSNVFVLTQCEVEIYKYNPQNNSLNLIVNRVYTPNIFGVVQNCNSSQILQFYSDCSSLVDFGDVNGDGRTDVIHLIKNGGGSYDAYVDYSKGTVLINDIPFKYGISNQIGGQNATFFAADINNDGLCDLGGSSYNSQNFQSFFTHFPSNGNVFADAPSVYSKVNKFAGTLGDFDGDGALDYLGQNGLNTILSYDYNVFGHNNKRMVSRIYNLRNEFRITYNLLTEKAIVGPGDKKYLYNRTTSNNPSYKVITPQYFVVTTTDFNAMTTRYGYENGLLNRSGKGFVGFEKVYTQNTTTVSVQVGNTSYFRGAVNSSTFTSAFDAVTASESLGTAMATDNIFNLITNVSQTKNSSYERTYLYYTQTGNNRFLSSVNSEQKDYLKSTRQQSTVNFDNTKGGNISSMFSVNLLWNNLTNVNSVTKSFVYQTLTLPGGANYFERQQATVTYISGANSSTYVNDFVFDNSGRLTSQVMNSNIPSLAVTTTFGQFNSYGLPLNSTVSAPDLQQIRTSQVNYDPTSRFIIKATNSLGHFEEATFEPGLGNKISQKDITGLVSNFTFNGLGQLIKSQSPTNAVNTYKYEWYSYTDNNYNPAKTTYAPKTESNLEISGTTTKFYDVKGNMVRSAGNGFSGAIEVISEFDALNRKISDSEPRYSFQSNYKKVVYDYDEFFRLKSTNVTLPNNGNTILKTINYSYNLPSNDNSYQQGVAITSEPVITPQNGVIVTRQENNTAGQITKITNSSNGNFHQTLYTYNEKNQPLQATGVYPSVNNAVTTFAYDALGRQSSLNDPSSGLHSYQYNSIGELLSSTSPNGNFAYTYDQIGRVTSKNVNGMGLYNFQYVTAGSGLEQISKIIGPDVTTEFSYDNFSRPIQKKETITNGPPKQFTSSYDYDKFNRTLNYTYPSGFKTTNEFDANGTLVKIKNGNTVIWELKNMQTPQLLTQFDLNNSNLSNVLTYDNKLELTNQTFGGLSLQSYSTNSATGDLLFRAYDNYNDNSSNNEYFNYDEFDRLIKTSYKDNQNTTFTKHNYTYEQNGNLKHKDDCGDYVYGLTNKPYQLTQVQNAVNNISLNTLNIGYNTIRKVQQIDEANTNKQFAFMYGNDEQRVKMEYKINAQVKYTRFYQDNYDRQENDDNTYKEWSYVIAPTGLAAVYYNNNGSSQLLYVSTDHLGSPIMLTDAGGNIFEQYSFDSWGRRRNPSDWNDYNAPLVQHMIRGYTGHEHLDEVGLINMNGRLYDPVLGRMLQPDNFVQSENDLQSFNRYSYGYNNPLKYTDPSGENPLVFAAVGAVVGGFAGWQVGKANGATGWNMAYYIAMGAVIGAGAGMLSAGIGAEFAVMSWAGSTIVGATVAGAAAGAFAGGGMAAIGGGDVDKGLRNGAITGAAGGFVTGAVGGGLGAFAGGATSGAVGSALSGEKDAGRILGAAAIGGVTAFGFYTGGMYAAWSTGPKNVEFWSWYRYQGGLQRYKAWGKSFEVGANVYNGRNGRQHYGSIRYGNPFSKDPTVDLTTNNTGMIGELHTHTARGDGYNYASPTDMYYFTHDPHSNDYFMDVYGYDDNVYHYTRGNYNTKFSNELNGYMIQQGDYMRGNPAMLNKYGSNLAPSYGLNNPSGAYRISNFFLLFR